MSRNLNFVYLAAAAVGAAAAVVSVGRALTSTRVGEGAVVLVTGGSRGLGLAIARRFAATKVRLVLASRKIGELQQAQASLLAEFPHLQPEDFYLVACDLAQPAECKRLVQETISRYGRIDVLVNNAGIIEVGPIEAQPVEAFERAMQVNFMAAMYVTWAALPYMREQTPLVGKRRAAIVNIASIGGKIAVPHMLPYSAAKFALVGFSEGLHAELRGKGIRVTTDAHRRRSPRTVRRRPRRGEEVVHVRRQNTRRRRHRGARREGHLSRRGTGPRRSDDLPPSLASRKIRWPRTGDPPVGQRNRK
jgi:NAD(P)-dependent dehydrogenase (short-subunit alcohol dehydrogenase family)